MLTDDDNEDQFYCTEAKLLELNDYFPNDFTTETYYEFQHELSKHQFEIALTLTFNHPCYDDYTASSYAREFAKLYKDRRVGNRRGATVPTFTILEKNKDPEGKRDCFHIHMLLGKPKGNVPVINSFETLKLHRNRNWFPVITKLISKLRISTSPKKQIRVKHFSLGPVCDQGAAIDYMLKRLRHKDFDMCPHSTNILFKTGKIKRWNGDESLTQRLSSSTLS